MWHPSPSLTPSICSPDLLCLRGWVGGDTCTPRACGQLQQLSFSWVITSKVKQGWGRVIAGQCCPSDPCPYLNLGIAGHKFPPCLAAVTNWAGLVISSILNHWYQHMSEEGHFMSRVIHAQSELAARICVIAVAFTRSLPTAALLFKPRGLTVSQSIFVLLRSHFLPPGYVYHMAG